MLTVGMTRNECVGQENAIFLGNSCVFWRGETNLNLTINQEKNRVTLFGVRWTLLGSFGIISDEKVTLFGQGLQQTFSEQKPMHFFWIIYYKCESIQGHSHSSSNYAHDFLLLEETLIEKDFLSTWRVTQTIYCVTSLIT